ncbi:MAG: hypothetical protein U0X39_12865 [Bacteroidales bacterium]
MKRILFAFLTLLIIPELTAQQIYLETGKVISNFDYRNSDGDRPVKLKGTLQGSIGAGARMELFKSAWGVSLGFSNNKYGASGNDPALGNYSEWEVSYLGINLGVDYEFFKPPIYNADRQGFSFYLKGEASTEFLLNGKQRLNSQVYDLSGEEEFDQPLVFLRGGAGLNYYITRANVVFLEYEFGRSVFPMKGDGEETLHLNTHLMTLGIMVRLFQNKK